MSASRDKGNRLEREVARRLIEADGADPAFSQVATSTGRVGNAYHLEVDIVSRSFQTECKWRQSIGAYLWDWLMNAPDLGKKRLLVLKRNQKRPIAVVFFDDLLELIERARER